MESTGKGTYGERFGKAFQFHLLAIMARDPSFVVRYRSALDPSYFSYDEHRHVAQAILTYVDQHNAVPTKVTLRELVKPSVGEDDYADTAKQISKLYAEDLSDTPGAIALVIEFAKTQAMINAVIAAADRIKEGELDEVVPIIHAATLVGTDTTDKGLAYHAADAGEHASWYDVTSTNTVPTNIAHLDRLLEGGGERGCLYALMATPKLGKTLGLVNIGYGALLSPAGYNVVHVSCELNRRKVARRYDARLMGKDFVSRRDDMEHYVELLMQRKAAVVHGRLFIRYHPTRTLTTSALRAYLAALKADGFPPDRVIVDYGDLMRPERRMKEKRDQLAGIYEDLREIAGVFECDVWTATQANRASLEKEIITMADIAESFEKVAIADGVFALCQSKDERVANKCRLYSAAVRDYESEGTIHCHIDRRLQLLTSEYYVDPADRVVSSPDDAAVAQPVKQVKAAVNRIDAPSRSVLLSRKAVRKENTVRRAVRRTVESK